MGPERSAVSAASVRLSAPLDHLSHSVPRRTKCDTVSEFKEMYRSSLSLRGNCFDYKPEFFCRWKTGKRLLLKYTEMKVSLCFSLNTSDRCYDCEMIHDE